MMDYRAWTGHGIPSFIFGNSLNVFAILGIFVMSALFIGLYVYFSLAWMTIARKLKYKRAWFAWVPFLNIAMMLQLGEFHWAWTFLILIPVFGWIALFVLLVIATWRIFRKRKYPGWFSLSMVIPQTGGILYLIAIGFVAWKDRKKEMKF